MKKALAHALVMLLVAGMSYGLWPVFGGSVQLLFFFVIGIWLASKLDTNSAIAWMTTEGMLLDFHSSDEVSGYTIIFAFVSLAVIAATRHYVTHASIYPLIVISFISVIAVNIINAAMLSVMGLQISDGYALDTLLSAIIVSATVAFFMVFEKNLGNNQLVHGRHF
ncbi:MAG: hypothetical protein AAB886_01275 [Patescibacteria group bacterium]